MTSAAEKRHAKLKKFSWEAKEPVFNPLNYDVSIAKALSFFDHEVDNSEKKNWVIQFWAEGGKDVRNLDKVKDYNFAQLGVLVRIKQRGYELGESHEKYISDKYDEFIKSLVKEPSGTKHVVRKTSEEKSVIQMRELCPEIDAEIDKIVLTGVKSVNVKNLILGKNVLPGAAKLISEFYSHQLSEIDEVLNGTDPDLKEGYSYLNKKTLRVLHDFLQDVIECSAQAKKLAKPRKVKEKPPAVVAAKVQYMKDYPELGLTSVHPSKIIGCDTIYLFNVKVRKLFKYVAAEGMSLTVKGTTLLNFSIEKSGAKTVRKPEVVFSPLNGFDDMQKRAVGKMFDDIHSVLAKAPGRISDDMIILKCFV